MTAKEKSLLQRTPTHVGDLRADGLRFAIVVSRFNEFITERLLVSAVDGLRRLGAAADAVEIVRVPGAFEIPAAARKAAGTGRFQAILCLGLILRGETPHFDYISREVTRGIGQSALDSGVPHAFGVLTCETLAEAVDRAGLKAGNKGFEAALAAVEMAHLFAQGLPVAPPKKKTEGQRPKAEGRRPKGGGKGAKAEDRRPKAEDRRPKGEGRRKKAEVRGPKADGRGPKAEDRGPKADV
ncbi:MAG: 6,7-dimethyl-8-ribityllumazine synthase [Terriglobales bacterium]